MTPINRISRRHALRALAALPAALAACGRIVEAPAPQPIDGAATPGATEPTPIALATDTPSLPLTPATATPGGAPITPIRLPHLEFGTVGHLYYTDRSRVLQLTQIAGFDWIRQQVHWRDIEDAPGSYKWGELDNVVDSANASGIKLLVNIVRSPDFYGVNTGKPRDPQALGNLVAAMVERYNDRIAAYEIWNEPNLAYENGGRVRPENAGQYVEILAECYRRIKALNPQLIVVAAAPSSTGVTNETIALADQEYLRIMYSYRQGMIRDHFDVQAVHPGAAANDPDWLYPENPGDRPGWNDHPTHYFRHIENTRALMTEFELGDRQIWLTEYGWATPNNTPGYEFGNLLSFETQAEYISRAVDRVYTQYRDAQGQPWVGAMFLWNINFAVLWGAQGNPQHEQASFSILNPDWSPRPAFIALQGLHQRLKQEQGRTVQ